MLTANTHLEMFACLPTLRNRDAHKRPHAVAFTEALPRTADGAVDRDAVKAAWGDTP